MSTTLHRIPSGALTIELNNPSRDFVKVSIASGATISAYSPGLISYDDNTKNYRIWRLQAYSTHFETTGEYFVHAKLPRRGEQVAMIVYLSELRNVDGSIRIETSGTGTEEEEEIPEELLQPDPDNFYIYIGRISASATVNDSGEVLDTNDRMWLWGPDLGVLDTHAGRVEELGLEYLSRTKADTALGHITFQKGIKVYDEVNVESGKVIAKELTLAKQEITGVSTSGEEDNELDNAIPTTAYVEANTLSSEDDDTAEGNITFKQDITVEQDATIGGDASIDGDATIGGDASIGGDATIKGSVHIDNHTDTETNKATLTIGDFIEEGDIIQGAQVSAEGVGSFAGLKSPFMQIYELIYNRKTAVQGEFAFSDGDTVEAVAYVQEDGKEIPSEDYRGEPYQYIRLTLREQYEGYVTSFAANDIIYSNINIIGQSGDSALTGKCWMRINQVEDDRLHLKVILYSDDQVPSLKNIAPAPHMVITRHGNERDENRQDVWVVSSEDGRMYQLTGVNSPIINTATCYATVLGKLPDTLIAYIQKAGYSNLNASQPYLYARGIVVQDLIRIDYKGKIVQTDRYRGNWSLQTAQSDDPYINNAEIYDTVTHDGSLWACQASGTTVEPSLYVTEWLQMVAKGDSVELSIYQIVPSVNVVYVREGEIISTNTMDVTVGVSTPSGYIELTTQSELDERGLLIQYAIDGEGERITLNIGGDASAVELEDGSGIIVDEADDGSEESVIMLEGESIDVTQVEDNITLYLVDSEGTVLKEYIVPVIKDGKTPYATFKSFVFTRSATQPSTPTGGSFDNPVPDEVEGVAVWSDGIPAGTLPIWESTRWFSTDPNVNDEWSKPELHASSAKVKIIYNPNETYDNIPDSFDDSDRWYEDAAKVGWTKTANSSAIWMAVNELNEGEWSGWEISKIKGEKGDEGTSIKIQGTFDSEDELPVPPNDPSDCYIVNGDLYVWDGEEWQNVGKFKGDAGESAYMHIKFAHSLTENDWTDNGGEDPGDYIGIYADNNKADSSEWNDYTWHRWSGENGKNAIRLDLDNENDAMLYDSEGTLLSGYITSKVTLYDGGEDVTDDTDTILSIAEMEGVTAELSGRTLTVSGCSSAQGYVVVSADYQSYTYQTRMSVKRIVNGVKYELAVTPSAVSYNETTGELSSKNISIKAYRVAPNQAGGVSHDLVTTLPDNIELYAWPADEEMKPPLTYGEPLTVDENWVSVDIILKNTDTNTVEDEETVLINRVKNGTDGADGLSYDLQLSPSSVSILVDSESGKTVASTQRLVRVKYLINGEEQSISSSNVMVYDDLGNQTSQSGGEINTIIGDDGEGVYIAVASPADTEPTVDYLTVEVEPTDMRKLSATLMLTYPQRGAVGPAGDTGALLYPAGHWDASNIYVQTKEDDGSVIATPFVYYDPEDTGNGQYYVLQQDIPEGGGISLDNTDYWRPFERIDYVFTKAMMANWARLAKAVFWGDYMFSARGTVAKSGYIVDVGQTADYSAFISDMFTDGRLNGAYIPNLFLDLENGLIKTNRLSETFRDFRHTYGTPEGEMAEAPADILRLDGSYNVKCRGNKLMMMPLLSDIHNSGVVSVVSENDKIDGIHSIITMLPDVEYESSVTGVLYAISTGGTSSETNYLWPGIIKHCTLLCADPRLFSAHSYRINSTGLTINYAPTGEVERDGSLLLVDKDNGIYPDMFFSVNGTLTKWLLLEPGTTANLRLVTNTIKDSYGYDLATTHIWIVENAGDFEQLDVRVVLSLDSANISWTLGGSIGMGSYNTTDSLTDLGINRPGRFYGSKRLRTLYDYKRETSGSIDSSVGSIYIYQENNEYGADPYSSERIADEITDVKTL